MLKAELHTHINLDPQDKHFVKYSAYQLIDKAAELGFHVLGITCHDFLYEDTTAKAYAKKKGILLLSGMERTIEGKHTLLYNISGNIALNIRTLFDLRSARQQHPEMLVIAAHPFHFASTCHKQNIITHLGLFDAWEYSFFHVSFFNPNLKTKALAERHGKPLIGNSDVHKLKDLGKTYSLIDASLAEESIFASIRQGKVQIVTTPLPLLEAAHITGEALFHMARKKLLPPKKV